MPTPSRILMVEDEPRWQTAIEGLLSTLPDTELVGHTDTFDDAMTLYDTLKPDIVLLDFQIRGEKSGVDVGNALIARGHAPDRLILVSAANPAEIPTHTFHYVPKGRIGDLLLPQIQAIQTVSQSGSLPSGSAR